MARLFVANSSAMPERAICNTIRQVVNCLVANDLTFKFGVSVLIKILATIVTLFSVCSRLAVTEKFIRPVLFLECGG